MFVWILLNIDSVRSTFDLDTLKLYQPEGGKHNVTSSQQLEQQSALTNANANKVTQ